mmetsp:Transcript_38052/g.89078  ORF Transcript_38052/g.89078 Transcript_38052/m.89078 type:complete len:299 (+) Transcript_38052:634-1530(+)
MVEEARPRRGRRRAVDLRDRRRERGTRGSVGLLFACCSARLGGAVEDACEGQVRQRITLLTQHPVQRLHPERRTEQMVGRSLHSRPAHRACWCSGRRWRCSVCQHLLVHAAIGQVQGGMHLLAQLAADSQRRLNRLVGEDAEIEVHLERRPEPCLVLLAHRTGEHLVGLRAHCLAHCPDERLLRIHHFDAREVLSAQNRLHFLQRERRLGQLGASEYKIAVGSRRIHGRRLRRIHGHRLRRLGGRARRSCLMQTPAKIQQPLQRPQRVCALLHALDLLDACGERCVRPHAGLSHAADG